MSVIPASQKAEIGRIMVKVSLGKKLAKAPSQSMKLGIVACAS
jgi:hypothetical protein